ncbi:hypothetical protein BGW36DRAFT_185898 [Talaromyces proteolyticus]|uniref:Uncharacterized protein n=1 Tax=Talaromyces proteolyticus TaxID=1131652 RepID=A0AAD4PZH0_9EURO|nr:uncharacterized protein BGW36DRAFT_185898 [Talaromyces proteolyticus]KAH8696382.1 hypothetical protein BGW36DRAFT_185898 [Talaromyces proteolyticus]
MALGQIAAKAQGARLRPQAAENSLPRGALNGSSYRFASFASMEELAKAAQKILLRAEDSNNSYRLDNDTQSFIQAVKSYAEKARGGDNNASALADLKKALHDIRQETTQIREELSKSNSNTTGISQPDSAFFWKSLRAREWQTGLRSAASPLSQSAGSSTPGVTDPGRTRV